MIVITAPGLATSIQSVPRFGFSDRGVPIGGPMDDVSAKRANRMLGNDDDAALLECTLIGPKIKFTQDTQFAVAGASVKTIINNQEVDQNLPHNVKANDQLSFGSVLQGCRFYIAFRGGLKSNLYFETASVSPTAGIGNYLCTNDEISIGKNKGLVHHISDSSTLFTKSIIVHPGPEYGLFTELGSLKIFTAPMKSHADSNRMAYTIHENETLVHNRSILTSPVKPGTVQLTPSGKLIILMRDAQLSGGYPRVLQLPEESINSLSQIKPGEEIRLVLQPLKS